MTPASGPLAVSNREGGVAVLTPEAALFAAHRDREILGETERLLAEGTLKVVIDLHAVTTIDSAGLGNVVASFNAVRRAGGRFALAAVPDRLRDLLAVTMLLPVIPLYPTPEEAAADLIS